MEVPREFQTNAADVEDGSDDPNDRDYTNENGEEDYADGEDDETECAGYEDDDHLEEDAGDDEIASDTQASTVTMVLKAVYAASKPSCSCKGQARPRTKDLCRD